jgi:hypothetical protein
MSLVKATEALNDIAGQYNLLEILNRKKCRTDPNTCTLTPQKIDQLQQVLTWINRNYSDDPMLSKLFALTVYSSNNKTLKGGRRHKNFKGGFKGILSVITLIISILIYVCVFKQDTMTKSERLQLENMANTIKQCNATENVSLSMIVDETPLPLVVTSNLDLIKDIATRLHLNIKNHYGIKTSLRPSVDQTLHASINMKYDKDLNKRIFNFELHALDKVLYEDDSSNDRFLKATEKYNSITDFNYILDHLLFITYNLHVSHLTNFFKLDDTSVLMYSMQLFNNRQLPNDVNPHGYHYDGTGEEAPDYVSLTMLNDPATTAELSFAFSSKNLNRHQKSQELTDLAQLSSINMIKKTPKNPSLRFSSKAFSAVTFKQTLHSSPAYKAEGHDFKILAGPYSSGIITHNGPRRKIGNKKLEELYHQEDVAPNGRTFYRGLISVIDKIKMKHDDFWGEKISTMIQALPEDEININTNTIVIIQGREIPPRFAESFDRVVRLAELQIAAVKAPDGCNDIVATPKTFGTAYNALANSPFAVGGKKKKNRTRKK